ncbi:MAG: glycine dehydrogenase [Bradymonadia bacterium]|jgi:glycine dehydrogenase
MSPFAPNDSLAPINPFAPTDTFARRHIGPDAAQVAAMLAVIGVDSVADLIAQAVPGGIRTDTALMLPEALGEQAALTCLKAMADRNRVCHSLIGMGYHDTHTPPVIQRNVLENPGWYTQYTPYQAEISQGRLEALVNFQTMIADLTGLPLANASLLDESTAAAEAMAMCYAAARGKRQTFLVAAGCHPQTIAVVQTRAEPLGIQVKVEAPAQMQVGADVFGVLLQYPDTHGGMDDPTAVISKAHDAGALAVVATDLLALCLLTPPGELGADIAVGSSQRFGVPLGYGGPHAGFISCLERFKRTLPGRIVGVSKDADGQMAYRLALQTREQHIRRDRATSNICTAQVLLAIVAGMYGVYHGPDGLHRIATRVRGLTAILAAGLSTLGYTVADQFFDTLTFAADDAEAIHALAVRRNINLRRYTDGRIGVALDETCDFDLIDDLFAVFNGGERPDFDAEALSADVMVAWPETLTRTSAYLTHPVFSAYRSEHAMLRYLNRLQQKDLSLTTSMIPLGSCTMKLNATAEMMPISWPGFAGLHPFAPREQAQGYQALFNDLEGWLAEITGFSEVSLQPNAGSQGEFAGLLVIRAWHRAQGDTDRNVCLIPTSAHGTNPASAVMAGMRVVAVKCDERGDVDLADLEAKATAHADALAALMITYPSTHGVFEAEIKRICAIVHTHGGQVYMDGANMNAQVGLCRPAELGADVVHLNLHKTFCIPHGGGGPGMGPIGVAAHLGPFLPGHPVISSSDSETAMGPVAAAPWGSPGILPISYAYIAMMGADGLTQATEVAILNANYMAVRLGEHYPVLFTGENGRCAHEFILDCRGFKAAAGVGVDDIAKRLMDYGFHAPTMSWPVAGTLMIEPTESEEQSELDRFCDAMIAIRGEIEAIATGAMDRADNPMVNAPHTAARVLANEWSHAYTREQAAFPAPWVRAHKYWPPVARVDNAYGDRNLMCTCPPMEDYL